MYWFIFHRGSLLLEVDADGNYRVPQGEQPPIDLPEGRNLFTLKPREGVTVGSFYVDNASADLFFRFVGLREAYPLLSKEEYAWAAKCEELCHWDGHTHFCSVCGTPLERASEISKQCPACGEEYWPQLSVAVIVLIRNGEKALLVRARNFRKHFFGLVAGFVETGETLEEALQREVFEETGLQIHHIQYYASQPWPYPSGLMVGFFADYLSGELAIDESELIEAGWFSRDHLPTLPDHLSIARRLIEVWKSENSYI